MFSVDCKKRYDKESLFAVHSEYFDIGDGEKLLGKLNRVLDTFVLP